MARTTRHTGQPCDWRLDDDPDYDKWDSDCGESWQFNAGGPVENRMRFCPYCGNRLRVVRSRRQVA